MGSTPCWGAVKSPSSHLAQRLRHAVSLWPVCARCLPGVISSVWCGLLTAPWPRATAPPPWGSMSTPKRGLRITDLGPFSSWRPGHERPLQMTGQCSALMLLGSSRHHCCGSSQGLEWRSGRRFLVMPFTESENVSVWSKVIPQERMETTLRPSASPLLSRPPPDYLPWLLTSPQGGRSSSWGVVGPF